LLSWENTLEKELIEEYFTVSERKKKDDKWLKDNGQKIKEIMLSQEKKKEDVGDFRVEVVVPNLSKFDEEKVLVFLKSIPELYNYATKTVLDGEKLEEVIGTGALDIDELKKVAWIEQYGSPRLTVKKVKE
jgi:hypothetical protein